VFARKISVTFEVVPSRSFGRSEVMAGDNPADQREGDDAQFGLAAHEAAAFSGAVKRFNPPAV